MSLNVSAEGEVQKRCGAGVSAVGPVGASQLEFSNHMATTVKESFKQFASNLNLTDRQATSVGNCRANLVAKIKAKLRVHSVGSAAVWAKDH